MGYVLPEKTLMETQKGKLLWAALRLSLRKLKTCMCGFSCPHSTVHSNLPTMDSHGGIFLLGILSLCKARL